jgi:polysaccharide biosynthesis protein PslH
MPRRALIVASRFPWPVVTGDRIRTLAWLEALAARSDVTLVAPAGRIPTGAPRVRFVAAAPSAPSLAVASLRMIARGLPATALLAAGFGWNAALARAGREGGPFDVAVVLLARLDPWVHEHVHARRLVFDAIDSLAANLGARAEAARGPARALWRLESARTARLERAAASRYDRVVVVADAERAAFGEGAAAVFHGVELGPRGEGPRAFDVGFWGRLAYFANRDAAALVLGEVWPRIREARPDARLLLAGADAPPFVRRRHGRDGITVISPMADRGFLLRTVKVALLPLRFGSGQSNKVLEAAEASCALVATPEALRGLKAIERDAAVESTPRGLADKVLALLADPAAATAQGRRLRGSVEREYSRGAACERLAEIALGGADRRPD